MSSRLPSLTTTVLAASSILFIPLGTHASYAAKPRPAATLTSSITSGTAGDLVEFTVKLKDRVRRPVVLEVRKGARWARTAQVRSTKRGVATFSTKLPTSLGDEHYRARAAKTVVAGKSYRAVKTRVRTLTVQPLAAAPAPTLTAWSAASGTFISEWTPVTADLSGRPFTPDSYDVELSLPGQAPRVLPWYGAARREFTPAQLTALIGDFRQPVTIRVRVGVTLGSGAFARPASEWSAPVTTSLPSPAAPTQVRGENKIDGVTVSWAAPTDPSRAPYLSGYRVYVSASPSAPRSDANLVYEGTSTNFTYTTLSYEMDHYFTVVSYWTPGAESDPVTVTGRPISPFGPS